MCSREVLMNFLLRDNNSHDDTNEQPYDDPDTSFTSKYTKWVRTHVKVLLLSLLLLTALSLAVLLSLLTFSFISKPSKQNEPFIISHKPNKLKLYTHEEQEFHFPDKNSRLDGDIAEAISLGRNMEQDRPYFHSAQIDGINFESTENAVSHNHIYHDGDSDEVIVENASPDEFRIMDNIPHHHRHKAIQEENAETRGKDFDLLELRATTVPVTDGIKNYNDPPQNPKPTKTFVKKPHEEPAETRHINDAQENPMTLYRVTNAVKAGAVCLDGSAPAYYHRPGSGNSEKLWILHFNGGAWCFDGKACFERSHSSLGSTKKLPSSPPIIQGINSPDPSVNPDFFDWNLVWVVYCDGASFTGNRERPLISDTGETIYLRGKRVLNAIINDLLFNRNFKNAEAIILTGSSAGSMTAMFQADYIASKFPKTIPVRVLSDAGFFIDTAPIGGKNLGAMFKRIYELQNSSAGLNQDCVRDLGQEDAWQCFLPAKTMKYIKTPMYVLNSAYDIWALIYFLDIDCKFPTQEQKQRRKRNIDRHFFVRTDSELDMSRQRSDISITTMFRRDLSKYKRKRDVSGFEMLPFFRSAEIVTKETIPDDPSSDNNSSLNEGLNNTTNSSTSALLSTDSFSAENESVLNNTAVDVGLNKNTNEGNDTTVLNHTTSTKGKQEKFTSFLKDLGSITTDNDMDILFHEIKADESVQHTNPVNKNNNKTSDVSSSNVSSSILHSTKNNTKVDTEVEKHEKPTTKSVIPFSTKKSTISKVDSQIHDIKTRLQTGLAELPKHFTALQRLDRRRQNIRDGLNMSYALKQYGMLNMSTPFKRQNLKDSKTKRSTSIAKEYINILRSDPPECTEREILNAMRYRGQIVRTTDNLMHMPKSGRFIVSCIDHSLSLFDETWTGLIVNGKSIQQAFGDWFYERGGKGKHDLVDCPYPCNPACP